MHTRVPALICLLSTSLASAEPVTFSAMGCGPYKPDAEKALVGFIQRENAEKKSDFIVHLGDIVSGSAALQGKLKEDYYAKIKGYLSKGNTIPTYVVPGDNEWNDCPNPDLHWSY